MVEYGLRVHTNEEPFREPQWLLKLKDSGTKWIRIDLGRYDPSHEPWQMVKLLSDEGFKILGVVGRYIAPWEGGETPVNTLEEWRANVQWALSSYGELLDAVEVWNEPDSNISLHGYMDGSPEHYFNMLKVAYEEIKAFNPNIKVVAGALMTLQEGGAGPGDYWGGTLLKGIWALGAANYCDAVSIHTYQFWLNTKGINQAEAIELARSMTGNSKPIWNTELGYHGTDLEQATWMRNAFTLLESVGCPIIIWHEYRNDPTYAIIHHDYSEKPAYAVFQEFASAPTPTPPILATLGGIGLGAVIGYVLNRKKPVVPIIIGAVAGGTVGFIIDRTLRS